jgi:hypothetical protein
LSDSLSRRKAVVNPLYGIFQVMDLFLHSLREIRIKLGHRPARVTFVHPTGQEFLQIEHELLLALGAPGPQLDIQLLVLECAEHSKPPLSVLKTVTNPDTGSPHVSPIIGGARRFGEPLNTTRYHLIRKVGSFSRAMPWEQIKKQERGTATAEA